MFGLFKNIVMVDERRKFAHILELQHRHIHELQRELEGRVNEGSIVHRVTFSNDSTVDMKADYYTTDNGVLCFYQNSLFPGGKDIQLYATRKKWESIERVIMKDEDA